MNLKSQENENETCCVHCEAGEVRSIRMSSVRWRRREKSEPNTSLSGTRATHIGRAAKDECCWRRRASWQKTKLAPEDLDSLASCSEVRLASGTPLCHPRPGPELPRRMTTRRTSRGCRREAEARGNLGLAQKDRAVDAIPSQEQSESLRQA